jgi:exonuclease VII small subunit
MTDKYFAEGFRLWNNLGDDVNVSVFWRKVKNEIGKEYEYPVARITKKKKKGEPRVGKTMYIHINQAVLDSAAEIRKRGAISLLKKELNKIEKEIDRLEEIIRRIEEHKKVAKELPEELKERTKLVADVLIALGKQLGKQISNY